MIKQLLIVVALLTAVGCASRPQASQKIAPAVAHKIQPKMHVEEGASASMTVSTTTRQHTEAIQETTRGSAGPKTAIGKARNVSQMTTSGDTTVSEMGDNMLKLLNSSRGAVALLASVAIAVFTGAFIWALHSRPPGHMAENAVWRLVGMILCVSAVGATVITGVWMALK